MIRRIFIIVLVSLSFLLACDDAATKALIGDFEPVVNDTIQINTSKQYVDLLSVGLKLNEQQTASVRKILRDFRSKRKGVSQKELEKLFEIREKKIAKVLNPLQNKLRQYVKAKFYFKNAPKNQLHPINLQKEFSLSDGQTLKLIEIVFLYERDDDTVLRDKRLTTLIGSENAKKYITKLKGI